MKKIVDKTTPFEIIITITRCIIYNTGNINHNKYI